MNLYYKLLKNIEGLHLRKFSKWCSPVHWLMTIKLADKYDRDNFILYMKQNSVECRQMVNPVHKANHLQTSYNEEEFKQSLSNSLQSVHLPSGSSLDKNTIEFICKNVKSFFNKNK